MTELNIVFCADSIFFPFFSLSLIFNEVAFMYVRVQYSILCLERGAYSKYKQDR